MNFNLNGKPPVKDPKELGRCKPTAMMLVNDVSRLMISRIQSSHDELFSQRSVRLLIMELAHKDGRTQLELVNATHLKAPTVSVAMQKLEKEGIVTRLPDEYDQRAMRVYLTEKGRELDDRSRKAIRDAETFAMEPLSDEEKETLYRLLAKIRDHMFEAGKDGDSIE